MITLLLIVIYIAFIGLGLPHSLFGAALPAIQSDPAFMGDLASIVTVLISGSTVISSIFGAKLAKKFGTWLVVTLSTALAAGALLGFSFSEGFSMMCVFAVPLGLSAGATDAALNNYIANNYSANHMNFLHCFYGIGFLLSPTILSAMISRSGWRGGYHIVFLLQCAVTLILLFSLPLWKKKEAQKLSDEPAPTKNKPSLLSLIKRGDMWWNLGMCVSANAIEGVVGVWGSTYLALSEGFDDASAAAGITAFYIGIALGRFLSGLFAEKLGGKKLLWLGTAVSVLGVSAMFFLHGELAVSGLFLVGLGNGPLHPNILYLTPESFGENVSDSVMGIQMGAAYFGIMAAPPVFEFLTKSVGAHMFPVYISSWLVIFAVSKLFFFKTNKA